MFSILTYNSTAYFYFFHEERSTRGLLTTPVQIQVNLVTQDWGGRKGNVLGTQKPEGFKKIWFSKQGRGAHVRNPDQPGREKSSSRKNMPCGGKGAVADPTPLNSIAALPTVQSVQNRWPQESGPGRPLSPRAARGTGTSCAFLLSWVHRPGHTQSQSSGTGPCARAEPCDIQEKKGSFKTSSLCARPALLFGLMDGQTSRSARCLGEPLTWDMPQAPVF